ncbi:LysR family transcriptional regulator [Acinetobacter sp. 1000160]|uniref:LysR family transcriptional regulator n=1 Tax=Acinetobacter sp. 1000160 TaxID=1310800 RepID=UPI00044F778B|nr:LysR family transcriptional regulator [Acinetobacter sp. 1000160]EXB47496.1 bacterial regulatory helix-turn-helix, lysR family protein [Acinetobacter baumannii 146457]EYT23684.1 bacterial regulatory helix-turn-helix, lysR family protein [Acinetobacter sp. 1000160]
MQIKSLEIFMRVVKLGSFSEAAKVLHTVQSNVTSHIKKLETELKVELLHRQNPVQPTRAGMQLYGYAEKMLHLQKELLDTFAHHQLAANFPLEIGSMETTAAVRLPALFRDLQESTPDFPFALSTAPSRELIDLVKASKLDCAFVANHAPIEGMFNFHVWTEKLVLISSKKAPPQLSKEYLLQKKFIAFKQGCSYRKAIDLFLSSWHLPAVNIIEMGSLDGIVSCVSLDVGLAILPISYVQQSHFAQRVHIHDINLLEDMHTYLIADLDTNKWASNMHQFFEHLQMMSLPDQQSEIVRS